MLRRLTLGFALVSSAALAVSACSSSDSNSTISIGPNFPSQSLYAANSTQNAIGIYPPPTTGTPTGGAPQFQIGGTSTTLNGPQYLAFDNLSNLFVTNYNSSTSASSIVEIKALATGNVLPLNSVTLSGNLHARGIAYYTEPAVTASFSPAPALVVAAVNADASAGFTNQLMFFSDGLAQFRTLAGPNTGLNVPSGVVVDDSTKNIYVTNLQGASVEVFPLPTTSPTPVPTATPTATPSPTPTPAGATPSPTPSPVPTSSPINIAPSQTIAGAASGIGKPTGIALSNSKIYVSDASASASVLNTLAGAGTCTSVSGTCPAVLIFSAGASTPSQAIAGPSTGFNSPTDVKVDKNGDVYVADTKAGAGVIYFFAANTTGNKAPTATFTSSGAVLGIGLTP